ncbi:MULTISPECIES: TRAP transporter small permease [Desulfococcus]|jgi:TRAP-type C4-dicarboxylate transport system permease small subunit|uniref:Tripartite ATP-independent periplasmic transporter DctQ component n=2 Tax=Desulfococcus multivorans TaxID=897 RepID=S7VBZ8_DESML|nr:TRAP transporter small permease [Desulfococcus multivorans]AOY57385.1 DctQ2: C4-TRAP dicarboxylate transporter [Desulfococcus multivorans]AQU99828.1 C4-dicarboxylate ABC transporter permease [Desulfococcus multivorans]EPR42013.1 Tripartite ATP-independent periplasmic transporter DctQ component [Desulfococcus multivorans DSM 2059]MDX9819656.1 TRAP transporter small permease [Desulfococcus multivorans]SKA10168.1 TRAP-type C4-dicarboxylate transport system, small permease component [Desulfococ
MNVLETASRRLNRGVEGCLAVMGLTMTSVVAAQVFSRYVLNQSLFWSEELARYLLVWLTFLGASSAYRRGMHPGVDVLYVRMSPGLRKAALIVVHGASMALFGVMIVFGCRFAYFVRLQISPALFLPKWILFAVIPLSGAILMVHALARLAGDVKPRASE